MALTLTSANAVVLLGISSVFPTPQALQGFAADDVTDIDPLNSAEAVMGVDGVMSAGFVFQMVHQNISLQADSPSNDIFDFWYAFQQQVEDLAFATGTIVLPGLQKKWLLTKGTLSTYKPMPDIKRTTQPRRYSITWQSITPTIAI